MLRLGCVSPLSVHPARCGTHFTDGMHKWTCYECVRPLFENKTECTVCVDRSRRRSSTSCAVEFATRRLPGHAALPVVRNPMEEVFRSELDYSPCAFCGSWLHMPSWVMKEDVPIESYAHLNL